jgi:tetratricopeptide (TPR) repeat protein
LFYALHPLHVEAVANIKSLDEILSMLLSVSASLFVIRSFEQRKAMNLILGSLAFFLALTAKENALTFVAIIPLGLFYLEKPMKSILFGLLPLVGVSLLYFLLRSAALGPAPEIAWVDNFLTNPFFGASFMQKIATILVSWLKYLQLMLVPYPLTTDYYPAMIPVTGWANPLVWISFLFFTGIAAFALWKLPARNKAAFGILYFFITFSVVSNLFINLGTPLNDRFLFMPLAGFCIAITYLLTAQLPLLSARLQQKNIMTGIVLFISLAYAVQTFSRNRDWKDDFTLFRHDIEVSGNSARCNVMTGKTYYEKAAGLSDSAQKKEYISKAVEYLNRGLEIYKGYYLAWGLLGIIEMDKQNYRQSLDYFVECLKIEPTQSVALGNLGFIGRKMLEQRDTAGCILSFRQLRHFAPQNPDSYQVMADVFSRIGKVDSALVLLEEVLKIDEKNAMSWRLKGEIYATRLNDEASAEKFFLRSYTLNPADVAVLDNLGVASFRKKDYVKAVEYFEKALALEPNNPHFMTNLASTYSALGNTAKVNEFLERAGRAQGSRE